MLQQMTDEEYQEKYGADWEIQKIRDQKPVASKNPYDAMPPEVFYSDKQLKDMYGTIWDKIKERQDQRKAGVYKQRMPNHQYYDEYGDDWQSVRDQHIKEDVEYSLLPEEEKKKITETRIKVYDKEKSEKQTRLAKFKAYASLPTVQEIFTNILGNDKRAKVYVESVYIQVAARPELQKCSARSIIIAAAQAASLKLSVDPIMQQAHLAVFENEVKMIPDYHGLVQMSEDTGYYEIPPNVSEVWEGEEATTDRFTGKVTVTGKKISDVITGWIGYFKAKNGTERWLHMTNEQCDKHGEVYNPGGYHSKKSAWNNKPQNRDKMRRKTVLRTLVRRWGHFSPTQTAYLISDEPVIDATFEMPDESNTPEPEPETKPTREEFQARTEKNLKELGF